MMFARGTRIVDMVLSNTRVLRGAPGHELRQARRVKRAAKSDGWGDWGSTLGGAYGAGATFASLFTFSVLQRDGCTAAISTALAICRPLCVHGALSTAAFTTCARQCRCNCHTVLSCREQDAEYASAMDCRRWAQGSLSGPSKGGPTRTARGQRVGRTRPG